MRADGLLYMLDRWGRLILPGTLLLFFVLLTLAPLRAPYLSDALPLLPALVVFQFSLATPERLPVLVERTRERAILAGDNSSLMRLTLLQTVQGVQRGDRIVTSGHGGSFPVGIPVGEVVQTGDGTSVRVRPFTDFSRLEFVRVVDYGVTGLVGPAAAPAKPGNR